MCPETATVFVVDDEAIVRESICDLAASVGLASEPYGSAQEFLDAYDPGKPGCLILDVRMPGMSGLALHAYLQEKDVCLPVIFLTGFGDISMAVDAVKGGAFDFVEKPFRNQPLLDTIQNAIAKDADSRRAMGKEHQFNRLVEGLTRRERQVMDMLVAGKSSKLIALELGLSRKTIDYHRHHILVKMDANTVLDLARMCPSGL